MKTSTVSIGEITISDGIFTYIWLVFMETVGKITIHGCYGLCKPTIPNGSLRSRTQPDHENPSRTDLGTVPPRRRTPPPVVVVGEPWRRWTPPLVFLWRKMMHAHLSHSASKHHTGYPNSLKLTAKAPWKIGNPSQKETRKYSNHPFSRGELLDFREGKEIVGAPKNIPSKNILKPPFTSADMTGD